MCVNVKSVNNASIGYELVRDNYANRAISNVRVLMRVTMDSSVPLAANLSDKIYDIFYIVENVSHCLVFPTSFLNNPKEMVVSKRQL